MSKSWSKLQYFLWLFNPSLEESSNLPGKYPTLPPKIKRWHNIWTIPYCFNVLMASLYLQVTALHPHNEGPGCTIYISILWRSSNVCTHYKEMCTVQYRMGYNQGSILIFTLCHQRHLVIYFNNNNNDTKLYCLNIQFGVKLYVCFKISLKAISRNTILLFARTCMCYRKMLDQFIRRSSNQIFHLSL